MKKLILIIAIILIAVVTNPTKADHQDKVKEFLTDLMSEGLSPLDSQNSLKAAGSMLGFMMGSAMIDKVVESAVRSKNYILFSLTEFSYDGKQRVIGIGLFGNVWLFRDVKNVGAAVGN